MGCPKTTVICHPQIPEMIESTQASIDRLQLQINESCYCHGKEWRSLVSPSALQSDLDKLKASKVWFLGVRRWEPSRTKAKHYTLPGAKGKITREKWTQAYTEDINHA